MAGTKQSLPFMEQYGGGLLASLFSPYFAAAFARYKPQEYKQLFGGMNLGPGADITDPSILAIRNWLQPYNPMAQLSLMSGWMNPAQLAASQNLIGNSYFGMTAPLDLSNALGIQGGYTNFLNMLYPPPSQQFMAPSGQLQYFNPTQFSQYAQNASLTPPWMAPSSSASDSFSPFLRALLQQQSQPAVSPLQAILDALSGRSTQGGPMPVPASLQGPPGTATGIIGMQGFPTPGQQGTPFSTGSGFDPGMRGGQPYGPFPREFRDAHGNVTGMSILSPGVGMQGPSQASFLGNQSTTPFDYGVFGPSQVGGQPVMPQLGGGLMGPGAGDPRVLTGTPFGPGYDQFFESGGLQRGGMQPNFLTQPPSLWQNLSGNIFTSLGGQMPWPQQPQAPQLPAPPQFGNLQLPAPPSFGNMMGGIPAPGSLPGFNMLSAPNINIPGQMQDVYRQLLGGQPGLQDALTRSFNPQIGLPGQNIFQQVHNAPNDAALGDYVNQATEGMQKGFESNLQRQLTDLQSRYAGEGSFLSSPMFAAQGSLTADLTAQHLANMGQMQLSAAEAERNRQYGAATEQYQTEYQRNAAQAALGAQQARAMAELYGNMAQQAASAQGSVEAQNYAAQLQATSNAYRAQADYLASTYGSQVGAMSNLGAAGIRATADVYGSQLGALANMFGSQTGAAANIYGSQLGALSNMFGTQGSMYNAGLNAAVNQQQIISNATQAALQLMQSGQAQNFDMAFKMAMAQQQNQQSALDALYKQYYQPGENALNLLHLFFGLPALTKSTGSGFDIGALMAAVQNTGRMALGAGA